MLVGIHFYHKALILINAKLCVLTLMLAQLSRWICIVVA